jgi:hypothetical protein
MTVSWPSAAVPGPSRPWPRHAAWPFFIHYWGCCVLNTSVQIGSFGIKQIFQSGLPICPQPVSRLELQVSVKAGG